MIIVKVERKASSRAPGRHDRVFSGLSIASALPSRGTVGGGSFKGIEGARGWLAWTVVVGHLFGGTRLSQVTHVTLVTTAGNHAVRVFILISGFVIANLLLKKRESYAIFIARRALRIYPSYLVGLALGIATTPIATDLNRLLAIAAGAPIPAPHDPGIFVYYVHVILHILLLQGMIPNNILENSQYMFLPPAWSLSLEWQFYLIAPLLLIGLLRRPASTTAAIVVAVLAYWKGLFGSFIAPSFILGAGWYFVLGMASRLLIERIPQFPRYPGVALIAGLPLLVLGHDLAPLLVGFGLLLYIRTEGSSRLLDSPVATYFGERSYAVYILHFPIILLCASLAWRTLGLADLPAIALTVVLSIMGTVSAAEIAYRWLERPMIDFGKRLGGSRVATG